MLKAEVKLYSRIGENDFDTRPKESRAHMLKPDIYLHDDENIECGLNVCNLWRKHVIPIKLC